MVVLTARVRAQLGVGFARDFPPDLFQDLDNLRGAIMCGGGDYDVPIVYEARCSFGDLQKDVGGI